MKSSKPSQLFESVLAAKLIIAWNAALAVANEIQRQDIDFARRAFKPRHL